LKVTFLRRYPESETKGTGIGSYSDFLESVLSSKGIDYSDVYFKLDLGDGWFTCLNKGFIKPYFAVKKIECDICHATEELCCLNFHRIKGKKIVTIHHISGGNEGRTKLLNLLVKKATDRAVKYSDAIIAVSEQTKKEIMEKYGISGERIYVMSHGPHPRFVNQNKKREKLIGFVGTLIERKNVAGGLRAFKKFTELEGTEEYRFVICGTGPLKGDLKKTAEDLGISDRVEFISGLTDDELVDFYNRMEVFLNSSMHEGLGLTALEAMACGTPVVCFADAAIPGKSKFINASDEEDFALKMYDAIGSEVTADRTPEGYGDRLIEIYEDVLKGDI
jgi:glycosyltransferase involved in cell wall biosynthesis